MYVEYNTPPLHEIDFDPLVSAWERSKHRLALMEAPGGVREREVIRRHKSEHKHTFFN